MSVDQAKLTYGAFAKISERLFRPSACDHEGMQFYPVALDGGYHIEFSCPKCGWGGAMHPDQLEEYERLAAQ